jgi:hypothetical protein
MRMLVTGCLVAAVVPAAVWGGIRAEKLVGEVGPAFNIGLKKADGSRVLQLDPGPYTLEVNDQGDIHSFHLVGPGVDQQTGVEEMAVRTFEVTFVYGIYRFFCDIHPTQMFGQFTVGNPPPPPPPPLPAPAPPLPKLTATVGPGARIVLLNSAGRRLTTLRARTYRITVKDLSNKDNFHLLGFGVNRKTGVAAKQTVTWTVKLAKGRTYAYRSDAHPKTLRGSVRAV